jgi:hypothetical protein
MIPIISSKGDLEIADCEAIIKKGFPELSKTPINMGFYKLKNCFSFVEPYIDGYHIDLDASLLEAPENVVIGCLAHEFAHIVKGHLNEGFWHHLLHKISPKYDQATEQLTDLEVILRGFGEELLAFVEWACVGSDLEEDWVIGNGLSLKSIQYLVNKKKVSECYSCKETPCPVCVDGSRCPNPNNK